MSNLSDAAKKQPELAAGVVGGVTGLVMIPHIPLVGAVVAFIPFSPFIALGLGAYAGVALYRKVIKK